MSSDIVNSKSKLKRLLHKNKLFNNNHYLSNQTSNKNNSLQNSLLQCDSSFVIGKQFTSIDPQLYKKSLFNHSNNSNLFNKQVNNQFNNFKENSFINKTNNTKQNNNFLNLPKSQLLKRHKKLLFNKTNQTQRQYAGRLTAKQHYRNHDLINSTSPLDIWKQINKIYQQQQLSNTNLTISHNLTLSHILQQQTNHKLSPQKISLLLNGQIQSDLLSKQKQKSIKSYQNVQQLINKWKNNQQQKINKTKLSKKQRQLQQNIILKKSLSCKLPPQIINQNLTNKQNNQFKQHKQIKQTNNFITQQQNFAIQNNLKESKIIKNPQSNKIQDNPVVLVHKQPLQNYMNMFFKPLKSNNIFNKQFKKVKVQQIVKIKAKKLTQRNIQHLQKLRNNLFKQKSSRDLFASVGKRLNNSQKCSPKGSQKQNLITQMSNNDNIIDNCSKQNKMAFYKKFKTQCLKQQQQQQNKQIINKLTKQQQCNLFKNEKNQDSTHTPSIHRVSPSSSAISFSEQATPQKKRKGHSFINAW